MIMKDDEIKGKILDKLARHRYWGGRHTDTLNLAKGFPKDFRKYVLKLVDELKRDNLIVSKPTSYGEHVSLNLGRKEEVQFLIDKFLKKKY